MSRPSRRNTKVHNETGYVLVLTAIGIFALILFVGLAIGSASWYLHASRLQRSADAAALAGSSALPDMVAAKDKAADSFEKNGIQNGDDYELDYQITSERVIATVTRKSAKTAFADFLIKDINLTRSSTAVRAWTAPAMGSPFNILGSGNLQIPGIPGGNTAGERQNFWLALNGECTAREDGDYFSALKDFTKGPFAAPPWPTHEAVQTPTTHTDCKGAGVVNPNYNPSGYSYFIDIPKPPSPTAKVDIRIFDPAWCGRLDGANPDWPHPYYFGRQPKPEPSRAIGTDPGAGGDTVYALYDTHGEPENVAAHTIVSTPENGSHPIMFYSCDDAHSNRGMAPLDPNTPDDWFLLATLSGSQIANGGTFRVQASSWHVLEQDDFVHSYGTNLFSIGAFASWINTPGCDTRTNELCPRVYGRNALSVYTNPSSTNGSQVDMYFAEIDPASAGTHVLLYLFDPGEGSKSLAILAPDGNKMPFSWTSDAGGPSGSGTDLTGLSDGGGIPGLSNDYKYNDRLVTIDLPIPIDYAKSVAAAGGSKWIKIQYTLGAEPRDRVTWGVSLGGRSSSPPHLVNH